MVKNLYVVLSFIGTWMLYVFPLYQGTLEMSEQQRIIGKFTNKDKKFLKISNCYWLLPFLKIHLEKKRAIKILKDSTNNERDYKELLSFFDKSLVWIYVSLAGLLNGLVSTHELVEVFTIRSHTLFILGIDILMLLIGIVHAYYRVTDKRITRELVKIKKMLGK
ncbi:hypothetical protein IAE51_05340 [Lactococcus sp. S64]|uniref:hypothetical protein n=1 Tax=Lactococcus sp. S64 TaxID=2767459 RepID=UPI00190655B0|nr:hypothetical protein [Lactococcus sp. S64]MBK0083328.1 hypothetical protein [Lactococcus sp. S64]